MGGRATNFGQKWGGDNTFCPGMGGHEILTWNGGGAGKYHLCLGEHEIYLKDWEKGVLTFSIIANSIMSYSMQSV